jgi:hypothetical protein
MTPCQRETVAHDPRVSSPLSEALKYGSAVTFSLEVFGPCRCTYPWTEVCRQYPFITHVAPEVTNQVTLGSPPIRHAVRYRS